MPAAEARWITAVIGIGPCLAIAYHAVRLAQRSLLAQLRRIIQLAALQYPRVMHRIGGIFPSERAVRLGIREDEHCSTSTLFEF